MSILAVLERDDLLSIVHRPQIPLLPLPQALVHILEEPARRTYPPIFYTFSTWTRTVTHAAAWARGRILDEGVVLVPINGDSADER